MQKQSEIKPNQTQVYSKITKLSEQQLQGVVGGRKPPIGPPGPVSPEPVAPNPYQGIPDINQGGEGGRPYHPEPGPGHPGGNDI